MSSIRGTSRATGALLVLATSAVLAAAAVEPDLTAANYLEEVAAQPDRLALAALFHLVAAGVSVGIAVALYPLLRRINAALALGSVVFRTIEAVFYTGAVVNVLSILTVAQQLAAAPPDDRAPLRTLANSLLSMRDHSTLVAAFAFNVGALMYYSQFYRSRLVPRWLSGWGIGAALLFTTACLLALFTNRPVTGYTLLILPIAIQETALAIWLLIKGVDQAGGLPAGAAGPGQAHGPASSTRPLQVSPGTTPPRGGSAA